LQTIQAGIGEGLLAALQSPQPLQIETILTTLLNEISTIPENFLLVLDDYHSIDSHPVDESLAFLIEHQPPQMHLLIATREDPDLPLARLRARGQCTELRAADLRFTLAEAADFLNQLMGLNLSAEDITALETRTEGWIVGLQLAALSMQGHQDTTSFIQSFTGSHHFVLDYLIEEVLGQQPESIQTFLLRTSILERMCGLLCDAILLDPSIPGQATLEYLERANLFIVPQDNERRWYRYHHLFGDLLRKRLGQSLTPGGIAELQLHASEWYENNDQMLEAFRHAAAANDIERAVRLMESKKMPLHLRGAATAILSWLESLPKTLLDARPALWWKQAALLLDIGQTIGVEEKLQAAEAALDVAAAPDDTTRDLIGKIALSRATLALNQFEIETILIQARRALEYLDPDNLSYRSMATLTLGFAYFLQGDLAEAGQAYAEALSLAQADGDITNTTLAKLSLGQIQAHSNQLYQAAETYQQVLELIGEYSPSNAAVAYISLATIYYEWNDLNTTEKYLEQSVQLARQYDHVVDQMVLSDLYLSRLKLARGDVSGVEAIISQAERTARQKNIRIRMQDLAYLQAWIHLRKGDFDEVVQIARQNDLPLMQARALIAQGNPFAALELMEPLCQQVEFKGWADRLLEVMTVQSVALYAQGEKEKAVDLLGKVLAQAEPGGFIRLFVDEGEPMRLLILDFRLWIEKQAHEGRKPIEYVDKLLAAFAQIVPVPQSEASNQKSDMIEPLSPRELEVLKLLRSELSGPEIAQQLIVSLHTLRTHTNNIFKKLGVNNRRAAVRRAEELDLL
jgi:LuxR family maltose regulon positive regulatory protein